MATVKLAEVKRLGGGSPVLYRRAYQAQLVVGSGAAEQRFPLKFSLERQPLGGWKVQITELDTQAGVGHDSVESLISELESDGKLP